MSKQYKLTCDVCSEVPKKELVEFINPDTGQTLGHVCTRCKNGMDQFKNDPVLMRRAITFLVENDEL